MKASPRSYLFVPGHRPERFPKALAAGADVVIIDLEDAVAPHDKDMARNAVSKWLSAGTPVVLRINGADTVWFEHDLHLLSLPGVAAVMLPKAESAAQIARVRAGLPPGRASLPVLPMIESALGLHRLHELAGAPGVERLVLGAIDLQVDLGLRDATDEDLLPFMLDIVVASRVAGIRRPVDGVSTAIDDEKGLAADVRRTRRLGFGGKLCIHPRQVAIVNAGLMPSEQEVAWATAVVAAAARSGGAVVAMEGKMIDKPVILRAEAILAQASR
jgi:citrate lyase subunit beta/citryl-CoA lyase